MGARPGVGFNAARAKFRARNGVAAASAARRPQTPAVAPTQGGSTRSAARAAGPADAPARAATSAAIRRPIGAGRGGRQPLRRRILLLAGQALRLRALLRARSRLAGRARHLRLLRR